MAKLSFSDRRFVENLFISNGYVLDLSNTDFEQLFKLEFSAHIFDEDFAGRGTSKGNRLRAFMDLANDDDTAKLLKILWDCKVQSAPEAPRSSDRSRLKRILGEINAFAPSMGLSDKREELSPAHLNGSLATNSSVFASYAHQGDEYDARVFEVVRRLRSEGIGACSDHGVLFPPQGWPRWMDEQLAKHRFILVFASETYAVRAKGEEDPDHGLGVIWEHGYIRSELYLAGRMNERFIPVGFGPGQRRYVPPNLRDYTYFDIDSASDYGKLFTLLSGSSYIEPPPLGVASARSREPEPERRPIVALTAEESGDKIDLEALSRRQKAHSIDDSKNEGATSAEKRRRS